MATAQLRDRVAIVTGGGDGIGRAIVRRFAAEGARVLVAEIDRASGELVADECQAEFDADVRFLRIDVADKDANIAMIDHAHAAWGSLDVLVNNAWGNGGNISRFEHKSDEEMLRGLHMGFLGPFWAMQHALPIMREQRRGSVVNICSLNGVNAHMGTVQYNAAKEALRAASRTAAREWAPWQVRVNVICPGAKTGATRAVFAANPELEMAADATNPMGRLGDPELDIAGVALFLAGDDARYVTGNTLFVDGGSHINGAAWVPDLGD
jgi:NAD(P)-dependent dehydrogenase (short-subunit alcohol dehydrogenase family)